MIEVIMMRSFWYINRWFRLILLRWFALLFSHLHTVDCKPRASVQLFMTDVALEMFSLLMLNENLFIIKISITVPEITVQETPWKNSFAHSKRLAKNEQHITGYQRQTSPVFHALSLYLLQSSTKATPLATFTIRRAGFMLWAYHWCITIRGSG